MNKTLVLFLATTLAWSNGATAEEPPVSRKQADAEWSQDGLQKTKVKGLDLVYVRPGASLAGYQRIRLEPVTVAFQRNFGKHGSYADRRRIDARDMQRIRDRLTAELQAVVTEDLARAGYALADAPGDDVLSVQLSVVNLYVNAPDLDTPGRVDVYTTSTGEMTLVAELADSNSGETLVRVYDRRADADSMQLELTTRVDNASEARRAAHAWAKALIRALDEAKKVGAD